MPTFTHTVEPLAAVEPAQQANQHRIGIFGGTFNPPHLGQLILADSLGRQLGLEKVYWLPNAVPPTGTHTSAIEPSYRAQMVKLAIMDNPLFELETRELRNGGVSLSCQTMRELTQENPENDYYWLMGADQVKHLPQWEGIDELSKLVTFVAGTYKEVPKVSDYPVIWLDVPGLQISASDLRTKIRLNHSIQYLVPDRVAAFINEYHLYRGFYD
ncbi:MAG TPA: nicotinate-nucleotide adenylyltransferase [Lactobacillaceae bacterium]|jgi:nicotinate-nucleotide adenylyltransferase